MRTDVKVGIALGAIVLIIAGSYYGTKKDPDIELADSKDRVRDQNARTLSELLSPGQKSKPSPTKKTARAPAKPESEADAKTKTSANTPKNLKSPSTQLDPALIQRTLRESKRLPGAPARDDRTNPWRGRPPLAQPADKTEKVPPERSAGPERVSEDRTRAPRRAEGPRTQRTPSRANPMKTRPARPPGKPRTRTHVIEPGDNFSKLAQRYYGSQKYAGFLVDANPNVDPRHMKIGSTVKIPPLPANKASGQDSSVINKPGQRRYEVQEGDSLYAIAEDYLGSGARWPEIYELNKVRIGQDPTKLNVGLILKLPAR